MIANNILCMSELLLSFLSVMLRVIQLALSTERPASEVNFQVVEDSVVKDKIEIRLFH